MGVLQPPLGLGGLGSALVLIFWAYIGFELVTVPSDEIIDPKKDHTIGYKFWNGDYNGFLCDHQLPDGGNHTLVNAFPFHRSFSPGRIHHNGSVRCFALICRRPFLHIRF